jgi:hypothetical protein
MLAQIIHHEPAAGDHLAAVGADQFERTFDQFRGDPLAAQGVRCFGVGNDHRRRRPAVIRERNRIPDVEFETVFSLVVAHASHV